MEITDEEIIKTINTKGLQSVRHLIDMETGTAYCIYITNRFRKIGWLAQVEGKYYGTQAKLALKEKDDIIDYYLTIDDNAKKTIKELCKK
jgi:hypothetical protein